MFSCLLGVLFNLCMLGPAVYDLITCSLVCVLFALRYLPLLCCRVSATQAPIIFIGTGEHLDDLEPFQTRSFVSKLLGYGDMPNLIKKFQSVVPQEDQPQLWDHIQQGVFTLRDMYDQFQTILKMGPLNKVRACPLRDLLAGANSFLGDGDDAWHVSVLEASRKQRNGFQCKDKGVHDHHGQHDRS